jgi:uncharacterized protein (DUF2164 family)
LISKTKDKEYVARLVSLADDDDYDQFIEVEVGSGDVWSLQSPRLWSNAIKNHFGTSKVCKLTNLDAGRLAEYKGYTVIKKEIAYLKRVLKADTDVVKLKKRDPEKRIRKTDMASEAQANLRWAQKLVEKATNSKIKKLSIVKFLDKPSQRGEALYQQWIKISEAIVNDKLQLLATLIHEMVHYLWGHDDLTHAFQDAVANIAAMIALDVSAGSKRVHHSSQEWKAARAKEAANADQLREEWFIKARRKDEGIGTWSLQDHLQACRHKELYPIARAFGVKLALSITKNELIDGISEAILAELDD